jgi:hypothetical protein
MSETEDKKTGRTGISNRPDLERPAPDKGKNESESDISLEGTPVPEIKDPLELDNLNSSNLDDDNDDASAPGEDEDDLDDDEDDDDDLDDLEEDDDDDEEFDEADEETNEDTRGLNPGASFDPGKGKAE